MDETADETTKATTNATTNATKGATTPAADAVRAIRPGGGVVAEPIRAWITWFGWGRIVAVLVSVVVVVGGGWLLVRAPSPPVERHLPMASSATTDRSAPSTDVTVADAPEHVVVHVAGAVRSPGVYTLPGDVRLHDAIDAAGGASTVADVDRLNLAGAVTDGQRIYVPEVGVEPPMELMPIGGTEATTVAPVDVNRADPASLETLPGVGPATAAAIVDDRRQHGPFATVDELLRVPGIGPAKLAALDGLVTV